VLKLSGLSGGYGEVDIVTGIEMHVNDREIVTIAGTNGAGKSTLIKAVMGLLPRLSGSIQFEGRELVGTPPERRVGEGIAYVPQVRTVFGTLTVLENLHGVGHGKRVAQRTPRASPATEPRPNLALLDVYGRVSVTLESQQGPAKPDAPITLTQITHQNIASRVGASREMVSRLLKDLEKGGYVELGVKRITLKKKLPARW